MAPKRGLTSLYNHVVVTISVDAEGIAEFGRIMSDDTLGSAFEAFLQNANNAVEFLQALLNSGEEAKGYAVEALKVDRVVHDLLIKGHRSSKERNAHVLLDIVQRCSPEDRLEILKAKEAFSALTRALWRYHQDRPNPIIELLKPYAPEQQDAILTSEGMGDVIRIYGLTEQVRTLQAERPPAPV